MYRECAALLLSLTGCCTRQVQAEIGERIAGKIAGLNTTDARKIINRTIPEVEADLDPEITRERLQRAQRNLGGWTHPEPDEMLRIRADLPAVTGRRWALDFEERVRAQKITDTQAGVIRTQAQRRADVFAQLPSQLIALIGLIPQGRTAQLLALASTEPDLAPEDLDDLEALAEQTLDLQPTPPPEASRDPEPQPDPVRRPAPTHDELLTALL
jgi:hypothetical protein